MSVGGYFILILVGAILLSWGLWRIRGRTKQLDGIGEKFEEIGKELDEIQADVKDSMSKLYREGIDDSE